MPVTAREVVTEAFSLIGVETEGTTLSAYDSAYAFRSLNNMIRRWSTSGLTIPVVVREVFSVTANQSTYTIGPGGDFDTSRPMGLTGASLLLNSSTPAVEVPTGLLTDDAYEAIKIKTLTNIQWTNVYYNQSYASGFGTIFLWPTPTVATNDLVLYRGEQLAVFPDLTTSSYVPPGYEDALSYQLALRLAVPYARPITDELRAQANTNLGDIKRQNAKMSDLRVDPALTEDRRFTYNINTGQPT